MVRPTLERAVLLNPRHLPSVANLALILSEEGKLDESIRLYQKTIELNPLFSLSYSNIANRYIALQMYEEAEKNLKTAVELDPENWHAVYVYALLYSSLGMYDNAKIYLDKFVQLDPGNIYFLDYAADVAKDFDEDFAEKYFTQVLNSPKFDPTIYPKTAIFFGYKQDYQGQEPPRDTLLSRTVEYLTDKFEQGAINGEAILSLAQSYAVFGNKSAAIDWFDKATKAGYIHDRIIRNDLWLKTLNDQPKFIQLMDKVDKRVAKMRESLRKESEKLN